MSDSSALHTHTPTLTAIDPRGLQVRSVALHRREAGDAISERVDRSAFDSAGRLVQRWDPRLWAAANQASETSANLKTVHSLSAQVLLSDSVDAGWSVELLSEAAQRQCRWDARGHVKRVEYDSMLRPVAVFEGCGAHEVCTERLTYGTTSDSFANQCGQLIRHDDPAGSLGNLSFNLTGEVIKQTRRFLIDLDLPDWPLLIEERDDLLELEEAESTWRFGPLGDVLEQTDAKGNTQSFAQTVAGQLKVANLQLLGQAVRTLVSEIQYDAQGRISSESAGNGVVTALDYGPVDGRLIRLRTGEGRLQDLNYVYDPVGNVVSIEDRAQPTRHFANQQIERLRTFTYDTLYQLIEANGYEAAAINRGPGDDRFRVFPTANELSNYTQRYEYDAGGNLQTLVHVGAQNHTRSFATSRLSNRSLLQTGDQPPSEEQIAAGFDAVGNLRELQLGQALTWDLRNQLSQITPVERESAANDSEMYRYDAAGMRVRKVRTTQARTVTHLEEVRYLPGLEIRSNTATGEELHVVTMTAGHSSVRVLHWQSAPPATVENDQIRYALTDHLGSSTLELDADAQLISQEIYYPYGETAWFAGGNEVEAKYKTVRYSGKERDASGLYYYGLRYYAPWLMRWINPDPIREAGGLNMYAFVGNHPVNFNDVSGLVRWPWQSDASPDVAEFIELFARENNGNYRAFRGDEQQLQVDKLLAVSSQMKELPIISEFSEGGNDFYRGVNDHLRRIKRDSIKLSAGINAMGEEFNILNAYSGAAYRAVKTDEGIYGTKIRKGDVVMDAGYMSASAIPRHGIRWLEGWTDQLTNNAEPVMFVLDKDIPKKVAGDGFLADHLLVGPGELAKVSEIHYLPATSSRKKLTVVGLKPVGHVERHDVRDIQTGKKLVAADVNFAQRLIHRAQRWATRSQQA